MKVAFYRVLYGEDFIQESINSFQEHFDKIYVFWADRPFGGETQVTFEDKNYIFPEKFDNIVEKVQELNNPKIKLIYDWQETPRNQHKILMERIVEDLGEMPELFMAIEPDMVFSKFAELPTVLRHKLPRSIAVNHIELWKTVDYRIPQRNRPGVIFYSAIPNHTAFNGMAEDTLHLQGENTLYNLGFCCSAKVMFWKHLTSLSFARKIGDSIPDPDWFRKKWLNWTEDTTDLAISIRFASNIPKAVPFKMIREDRKLLEDKILKIREQDKEFR